MSKKMIIVILGFLLTGILSVEPLSAATSIKYGYDKQNRLTQATYSDQAKVTYSYDAANNLDLYVAITDAQYLKSFLLYLSWTDPIMAPTVRKYLDKTEYLEQSSVNWPKIWASLQTKT